MPVQDIYKFTMFGDNRRIIAGSVISGSIHTGDEIVFYPSGKRSRVSSIEAFSAPEQTKVGPGRRPGCAWKSRFTSSAVKSPLALASQSPKITSRLRVSLFWLGKKPLQMGKEYLLKLGTARVKVHGRRNSPRHRRRSRWTSHLPMQPARARSRQIDRHQVAECTIKLNRAIAFDLASEQHDTRPVCHDRRL